MSKQRIEGLSVASPYAAPTEQFVRGAEPPTNSRAQLEVLIQRVRARWRRVAAVAAVCVAGTIVVSLLVKPLYTSDATILPESRSTMPGLSPALLGMAAQFGVSLGGGGAANPQFYTQLLDGRELRTRLLMTRFPVPGTARDSATLLDILDVSGKTPARRLEKSLKRLDALIATDVDMRTSTIHIAADAIDPKLAQEVVAQLIYQLNLFNLERRQSQARQRRIFVEGRVAAVSRELREAEDAEQDFYDRNRNYENSASLRFQEQRLKRAVAVPDELLTSLRRDYESARIEEVNDTPVLTVIDSPNIPDRHSWPRRTVWAVLALIVGVGLGTAWALIP